MRLIPSLSKRQWAMALLPLLAVIPAFCAGVAISEGMGPGGFRLSARPVVLRSEPGWAPRGERTHTVDRIVAAPMAPPAVFAYATDADVELTTADMPAEPQAAPVINGHAGSAGPEILLPSTPDAPMDNAFGGRNDRNLVEMRLGPFASRTSRGIIRNGELLIQVEVLGDLLELPYGDSLGMFALILPGGKGRIAFDSTTKTATAPNAVTRNALILADGRHYAPLSVLATAIGVEARYDPEQQLVMILPMSELPAVRRIRRERARKQVADDASEVQPTFAQATLAHRGWNGLTMDYDLTSSSIESSKITSYDFDIASRMVGGTASIGIRGAGRTPAQFDATWTRVWQEGSWIRQLRLGDGPGSGPRPGLARGMMVTNAPPYRPLVVEALPFAGSLEPGWSVEAYRSGQLVAFDSTGEAGRYEITLPIHYGENPVDFVAYGPLGEVRTFNQTFRALPNMLPRGSAEYALSAGECRYDCESRGNADLRLGITRRVTTRAGLDYENRTGTQFWTPYFGMVANPVNDIGLELETVRNGFDRATMRFEPNAGMRTVFDYVNYADQAALRRLGAPGRENEMRFSGRFTRRRDGTGMALEASASRYNDQSGHATEGRVGISSQQQNILLRPYLRTRTSEYTGIRRTDNYAGAEVTLLPRQNLGPILGRTWLRAEAEFSSQGNLQLAAITAMRNLFTRVRMEGGYRWQRDVSGSTLWLGIVSELSAVRYSVRGMNDIKGDNDRVEQSLGGSVVYDKYNGRALFSAEPATDRTGVTGTVFLDTNADGKRQTNEPVLSGVRILTPGQAMITDTLGRFQLWGLQAFEPVRFSVDTSSLPDPQYIPARAGVMVTPELGQLSVIELAVDVGAILEGRLEMAPDVPPLNGSLRLTLTEQQTGAVRTVETFQDGSFYIMGVRPGKYRLTVDPEMLKIAGLASDPIEVTVPPNATASPKPIRARIRSLIIALRTADESNVVAHAGTE